MINDDGGLEVGSTAYVEYVDPAGANGQGFWEERLILGRVGRTEEYCVASPDFEVYVEELSLNNVGIHSIRFGYVGGGLPVGMNAPNIYGFGAIAGADHQNLLREGKRLVAQAMYARGIVPAGTPGGAPVGAVAAVVAAVAAVAGAHPPPPRVAAGGGVWVIDEPTPLHDVGVELTVLPVGALVMGTRALVSVDGEPTLVKFLDGGVLLDEYAHA